MESYVLEWANLLLRWLHVITAIAWVGSSFYFVFLDSSLTPPQDEALQKQGASGELWAVHGGGFYHPVKFNVSPPRLPEKLHWFYWESYTTWLSGFALLTVSYLWNAPIYLVDPANPQALHPHAAIGAALALLVVFWLLYDGICRVFGQRPRGDAIVGALVLVLVGCAAWIACRIFPGQAAFLLVGAMLATAMSANVFFWIIPGQRTVVRDLEQGRAVDPIHGQRGKQRSVHNTYFTLPVLFAMLSNHYGWLYNHAQNWLVLVLMMFAGAAIRQFFVLRHGHQLGRNRHPWPYALVGVLALSATALWLAPQAPVAASGAAPAVAPVPAHSVPDYDQMERFFAQHCVVCHSPATLVQKNVRLDAPDAVKSHAAQIYQQVVVQRKMPFGNPGALSAEERDLVKRWYEGGAPVR